MILILVNVLFPLPEEKPYSQTVMAADSSLLCAYLTPDEKWRMHTSLDEVNPEMVKAIIAKEDRWFYYHSGVNPFALFRAFFSNITTGKRVSGASTITMQLARMSDRSPRTYFNKFKEMFRAFQFEWKYSKREILEMYLSYLPYGGNVEGVAAASYIYLNRPPEKISLSQSILLTVIPNRPNSLRLDRHGKEAQEARDKWIERFKENEVFAPEVLDIARHEPVGGSRYSVDQKTPHICYELIREYPRKTRIYTTIEPTVQEKAQTFLSNHVQRVKNLDVSNGAVLVIDNTSQAVIAYCGSADFSDSEALGQVNGVVAIRSPGSTLKSAAYGLGFDLGLITPQMKLLDIPGNFQSFVPQNYDLTFNGEVTVEYALSHSLNIPPVRLVHEMDIDRFLNFLEQAGFETVREKRSGLGLSAVLGGCGVTLEELTRMYSSFANQGKMPQIKYLLEEKGDTTGQARLFSPGAAWMVANILSDLERPDIPQQLVDDSKLPKVA
ncbi:MAG: penicillin-binding protein 1C, partial [Bacteroidetes bacterium]|nr:penicillin-binding protein 1C [Bacteroidota bacterium]